MRWIGLAVVLALTVCTTVAGAQEGAKVHKIGLLSTAGTICDGIRGEPSTARLPPRGERGVRDACVRKQG